MGMTPNYKEPSEMEGKIDGYFEQCKDLGDFPTVPGLAIFLGFADKQSLIDYSKKPDFSFTIKKAKAKIYDYKFQAAARGEMDKTIYIFDAVNNHGMFNTRSDNRTQSDVAVKGELTHHHEVDLPPYLQELIDGPDSAE